MAVVLPFIAQANPAETFAVTVTVDASKRVGELAPIWRYFGADEPNYATCPSRRRASRPWWTDTFAWVYPTS